MTDLDILAALEGTSSTGQDRCTIQRFLDTIPDDTPGKDQLTHAILTADPLADGYRTLAQTQKILRHLGKATGQNSIGDHRATPQRCRCAG